MNPRARYCDAMSQQNVEIVRRALDAFGQGDVDGAMSLTHPELVSTRVDPDGAVFHGRDGFLRLFADWVENFTEYSFRNDEYIDAGDSVIVQMRPVGARRGQRRPGRERQLARPCPGRRPDHSHRHLLRQGPGVRGCGLREGA